MSKTSGSSSNSVRERSFSVSEDEAEHSSSDCDMEVFSVSSIGSSTVTDESEL